MATVLIVDDEKNIRSGLQIAFEDEGYDTLEAEDGSVAWKIINTKSVDLVITDLRMPVMTGHELLKKISASYPTLPVIVLTGHGSIEDAVKAMHDGALDFLTKPPDLDALLLKSKRVLDNVKMQKQNTVLQDEIRKLKKEQSEKKKIIGSSECITEMVSVIEQVAPTMASVLITGESGTGKELVVDMLHSLSNRKDGPLVKLHCASLSPTLLESELFGHEKGAFTGAVSQKKGRFELADGGTIFLDEIGEINSSVQIKLLRVLQERTFERVGGEESVKVDVRIVCATNRNLAEEVKKGNFREDLFYRLNVVHIEVPPLRRRKGDIPLLIDSFIKEFNKRDGRNIQGFSPAARKLLYSYSWPGNVRELRNCVESSMVLSKSDIVDVDSLPEYVLEKGQSDSISLKIGITLDEAEKELIVQTMDSVKGNKTLAAKILGIGRKTLHRKLAEYDLESPLDE